MNLDFIDTIHLLTLEEGMKEKLRLAAINVYHELLNMNVTELAISDYNQRYLHEYVKDLPNELTMSVWILGNALQKQKKPLTSITFIEYGGGTGIISLLAKKTGIGTVIYNDIYDVSCKDAKEIARHLESTADYYVEGDIEALIIFCEKYNIKCDCMVSNDVLEHIYDIDDFLTKLHKVSHPGTTMMHVTGANMFFYPYVKSVMQAHLKAEKQNRPRQWGHKERDSLESFFEIRKRIIGKVNSSLSEDEKDSLAYVSRGLRQEEIRTAVDQYLRTGQMPKPIEHSTNTCDPYTGNWAEHLMNPYHLLETLRLNGFCADLLPLFWPHSSENKVRNLVVKILNFMINKSNEPLYFSSGFALYSQYNGSFSNAEHQYGLYHYRRSYIWWYLLLPFWMIFFKLYEIQQIVTKRLHERKK